MKPMTGMLFGSAAAIFSLAASAEVTFYDNEGFRGRTFIAKGIISDLSRVGFNDRASSAVVSGGRWEVCTDAGFSGDCRVLREGNYDSLNDMGLGHRISSVRPAGGRQNLMEAPAPLPAANAEVTFYDNEGFRGRAFTANRGISDLSRYGFNDRAASAVVTGGRWEVCTDAGFSGDCRVLREGSYDSLNGMGLGDRISSMRPVASRRNMVEAPAPLAAPNYEYRQRPSERLYEAEVTSARAIYGADEQRCWVDRERVSEGGSRPNVAGAIVGGILGGVLGHQIGSGRGNDVATGLGALGGAAIGANQGRDNNGRTYTQDVKRCETVPGSGQPVYWDVEYIYNGTPYRMQMTQAPGRTVTVNSQGEPRG